uniref:non-specific serine/threonine protein kinase n=1 Tax=Ciona savignyi TaxID=51511 RepID=H2ZHI2_CIOSA
MKTNMLPKSMTITSTPIEASVRSASRIRQNLDLTLGVHTGHLKHKNGCLLPVTYEIQKDEASNLYCIRISFTTNYSYNLNQTLSNSFASTLPSLNASAVSGMLDYSLGAAIRQAAEQLNESSSVEYQPQKGTDEWSAIQGAFMEHYDITKAVGNGAFGFVRMTTRKEDGKKFVVKFIRKEKVLDECWVEDDKCGSVIPLEISLLTRFNHPHIVQVLEYFENNDFFSMLMPMHGTKGFDLFEFIDREPKLDEALASYIFRQIASAVDFLHQEGVVHRDIKDENVIIDEYFQCKLIDFGSASFYQPGKTFSTFCGTIEYCSPEVLLGNSYQGPELEMWALGVTLYTLVFGENPFLTAEDTIEAVLKPPNKLSDELMFIIQWLLQPVPEHRCTMYDLLDDPWVNMPVDPCDYKWEEVVPTAAAQREIPSSNLCGKVSRTTQFEESFDSDENLAYGVDYWEKETQEDQLISKKIEARENQDNIFPLTRRLENMNLNHSI